MGTLSVNKFTDAKTRERFTRFLLKDIQALDLMLREGKIESGVSRIGAEQELCLLNKDFEPAINNIEVLELIDDPHFVPELAKFNIEANLDPLEFKGDCFDKLEAQLRKLLNKAHHAAEKVDTKLLMTGILPTLRKEHLEFEFMTPNPRYTMLNEVISDQRGSPFELNIMAVDELITTHNNILFEACNTSFQVHLQIEPDEFVNKYNWSQMIAGPVLSVSVNSPLLLGKRLWKETRISLFQQSTDTRPNHIKREQEPRVTFGHGWATGSAVDIFKDNISRYGMLFSSSLEEDALEVLKKGETPELNALKLHNSTVYKWNRACYGVSNGLPHLRIENRYLPSGPTVIDEMANAAFWLGIMNAMPDDMDESIETVPFEDCRYNFYNAARNGLDCQFKWKGRLYSAQKLLKAVFLPLAKEGLEKARVNQTSIDLLLGVISKRLDRMKNGAKWTVNNFSTLLNRSTAYEASMNITELMYHNQLRSKPVHTWRDIDPVKVNDHKKFGTVRDIMERELFIANEEDIVDLVVSMMDWKNIRSIPVENSKHEVVGLITVREILHYHAQPAPERPKQVKDIMLKDPVCIPPETSTEEAVSLLASTRACCLLVKDGDSVAGIVTESDIIQVANMVKIFKKG